MKQRIAFLALISIFCAFFGIDHLNHMTYASTEIMSYEQAWGQLADMKKAVKDELKENYDDVYGGEWVTVQNHEPCLAFTIPLEEELVGLANQLQVKLIEVPFSYRELMEYQEDVMRKEEIAPLLHSGSVLVEKNAVLFEYYEYEEITDIKEWMDAHNPQQIPIVYTKYQRGSEEVKNMPGTYQPQ